MFRPNRPLSALPLRKRSSSKTPNAFERLLEAESDVENRSTVSAAGRGLLESDIFRTSQNPGDCSSVGCFSARSSPRGLLVGVRDSCRNSTGSRCPDYFDESLEEYIQLIRSEGQKALALSKSKISVEVNQRYEVKLLDLRNKISEGENIIKSLEQELEQKRDLTKRIHKQLINVSRLCGSARGNGLIRALTKGSQDESRKYLILKWKSNARAKRLDRDGARVYVAFYMFRVAYRVWSSWRVSARSERVTSSTSKEIKRLIAEKDKIIEATKTERDTALSECSTLQDQLRTEAKKREDMMHQIRNLFQAKLEGLSSEVIDAIEHSSESTVPVTPSGLPFVNCDPSAPALTKKPPLRPLSASSRKSVKN